MIVFLEFGWYNKKIEIVIILIGAKMNDDKIIYLQMLQSTIERMSTTSAIFKGFCATIMTGITAISFQDTNKWILLLSFLPVGCFYALDTYYFILERKYRILYELVRMGKKDIDYDMRIKLKKSECIDGGATLGESLRSPSIYLYYFPLFMICIVILIIKFCGGI